MTGCLSVMFYFYPMLKSMTGFGTATLEAEGLQITADVKCLNSKFAEIFVKLPREHNDKEVEIRGLITNALERGKINFSLEVVKTTSTAAQGINFELFKHWHAELTKAATIVNSSDEGLVKMALGMPEVISQAKADPEDQARVQQLIRQTVTNALEACNKFRQDEGAVLAEKLKEYIEDIRTRLVVIEEHDPARLEATRQRLYDKLTELGEKVQIDNNRFEQELIYYLEKLDVSEEKVRLKAHLDYFIEAIAEGNGKKLGFIAQEIGREINTIGSKINDASVQRIVVEMKDLLERIKEQSLNVL